MSPNLDEVILDTTKVDITGYDIDGREVEIFLADRRNPDDINQTVKTSHRKLKTFLIAYNADQLSMGITETGERFNLTLEEFDTRNLITPNGLRKYIDEKMKIASLSMDEFLELDEAMKNAYLFACSDRVNLYERPTYINSLIRYIFTNNEIDKPLFNLKLFEWAERRKMARLRVEQRPKQQQLIAV